MIAVGAPALVAAATLVHLVAGASALYGVYEPGFTPALLGPLLGVNHLASLLSIGAPLALALALTTRGLPRLGWLVAAAALAGVALLTGSRGGAVGLLAGLVAAIAILSIQRRANAREQRVSLATSLPIGIIAACAVLLLGIFTAGTVAGELQRTTLDELEDPRSKFQVWGDALPLVEESRWLGIGRGAFEPAFTPYTPTSIATYSHAENTYLQVLIDVGIPGALAVALALVGAAAAAAGRWRKGPLEAAVLGALVGLAVHELADFSLEVPAVVMLAIVAASIVFPERLGASADEHARRRPVSPRVVGSRVGLLGVAATLVVLALSPLGRTARTDEGELIAANASEKLDLARAAIARHPADYAILSRASAALDERGDERALAVIRRALERNPRHGGIHHLAARLLHRANAIVSASAEFALAARYSRDPRPVVADVLRLFASAHAAARALPTELDRIAILHRAMSSRPDVALAYAARVVTFHPRAAEAHAMLATAELVAGDPTRAVEAARAAWHLAPTVRNGKLLGQCLVRAQDIPGALAALRMAVDQTTRAPTNERIALLLTLGETLVTAGDLLGAKQVLDNAGNFAESDRSLRALVHLQMAVVQERMGNAHQAAWERTRARELQARP